MIRIATIVGARPQFIKAAVVSRAIAQVGGITEFLIHTGQHYDEEMSGGFFGELGMAEPYCNLGIGSGSHAEQTGRMLEAVERELKALRPDCVLLYGDTNSTLAGALAAARLPVPVAHVEAGLRSFNRAMPEEINRIVADHLSDVLFPPTAGAERQLRAEGLGEREIAAVGDVMYDAIRHALTRRRKPGLPERLGLEAGRYLLATIHRAENTDSPERLQVIVAALLEAARHEPVVLPLHPRTRAALEREGTDFEQGPLRVVRPLGYFDMQALESGARVIITDSGGVQKEAFWHGVPCVTLRAETEWTELIEAGWNRLCPPSGGLGAITAAIAQATPVPAGPRPELYGDGHAGGRIVAALLQRFSKV